MSRDINEYFHEHCDKMLCEKCEMENDQKEEYVCYHQGFYVKGYQKGRADERERIVKELEKAKDLVPVNRVLDDIIKDKPKELGMLIAYDRAIEIARGEENE